MDDSQELVDALVKAVQDEDVLFCIYYIEQLPPTFIDAEGGFLVLTTALQPS